MNIVTLVLLTASSLLLFLHSLHFLAFSYLVQIGLTSLLLLSIVIHIFAVIRPLFIKLEFLTEQLQQAHTHDTLTGVNQRYTFLPLANQAIALSQRYQLPLSIIRFDIDHFTSINTQYGNQVGDKVIKHVAKTISANCRESDNVFRFDGEEFILLLPQTNQEQALTLATKINQKVLAAPLSIEKLILEVSVSGGVSEWQHQEPDIEQTLTRAGLAMLQAKNTGRNKVILDN